MDERAGAVVYMASRLFRDSDTAQLLAALWSVIVEMEDTSTPAPAPESDNPSAPGAKKAPPMQAEARRLDLRRQVLTSRPPAQPDATPSTPPGTPSSTRSVYSTPSSASAADDGFGPFLASPSVSLNSSEMMPTMSGEDFAKAVARQAPLRILNQIETDIDVNSMSLELLQSAYAKMRAQVALLKHSIPDLVKSLQKECPSSKELERFRAFQTLNTIKSRIAEEQDKKPTIPGGTRQIEILSGFSDAQTDVVATLFQAMANIAKRHNVTVDKATDVLRMNMVRHYVFERKDGLSGDFDKVIKAIDEYVQTGTSESKSALDKYPVVADAYKHFENFRTQQLDLFRMSRFQIMAAMFRGIGLDVLQKEAAELRALVEQSVVLCQDPEHKVAQALLLLNSYFYVANKVKLNT